MMLFFVGILEMLIVSTWTKLVSTNRILGSGIVTIFNILIWYYVLQTIVADIQNWQVVGFYAVGCAVGTVLTTSYFQRKERLAKHN
jgi:ABC-type iron transport system FetAB permease component